jgi:2-hydroxy-3-keto-5-methylthiopentenyl-1-phosphate phosphatase
VRREGDESVTIGAGSGRAVVLDFDGTVTEEDMLDRICREFGDPAVYDEVEAAFNRGEIRLVDDIERKLAAVRAPLGVVVRWLHEETRIRPGFAKLVELAHARGWRLVIVTSSFHELVGPVLGRFATQVEVVANTLEARRDGWHVQFVFGPACEACGEPCKRALVEQLGAGEVVYVGDGYSDRCVAQRAERVFATAGLASFLDGVGVGYEPFSDFHDVVRALRRERATA